MNQIRVLDTASSATSEKPTLTFYSLLHIYIRPCCRFDDLLVGAPFEYSETVEGSFGGAVYVYYSSGQSRRRHENAKVFLEPVKIRGQGVYSQFGISITRMGNLDGDSSEYNGN